VTHIDLLNLFVRTNYYFKPKMADVRHFENC